MLLCKGAVVAAIPDWIWFIFIFAFGCCVGSFLNVVIYRLPREKSIMFPPSSCPACGRRIRPYDNIPLLSWLLLKGKCRDCKAPISPRYFAVEMLTSTIFIGLFILFFHTNLRSGLKPLFDGGWFIYITSIILLSTFIAASAIDLEYWVIPLSICWFATVVGLIASAVGVYIIQPSLIRTYLLLPSASVDSGALAAGAAIGLAISWVLLVTGLVKRSYESENPEDWNRMVRKQQEAETNSSSSEQKPIEPQINHRLESCREVVFLLPIIACSVAALIIVKKVVPIEIRTNFPMQHPVVAGLLGSLWGYFVGCGVVWAVRILGTLAFGKEAMGMGDVHLMGAAGAVVGPLFVVVAFFIAPFFGLAWAAFQMFFKKIRQIPYGPFLSLGVFAVIILHDWIRDNMSFLFYR
jgi:leader peptidase (prepilin peptidase)/N-methyltransferase